MMVGAHRQQNFTILSKSLQHFSSYDCKPHGAPVRPPNTVEAPNCLLTFGPEAHDQDLVFIGIDRRDDIRFKLLETQVVKRALKNRKLKAITITLHDARNIPKPLRVADVICYEIVLSAH